MNKVYSRIIWKNYPNTSTAINETNLNRMDKAIDDLDNRVIEQDSTKANQTTVNNMVKNWTMDETTGVITVEKQDGSKIMFDLNIEKIPVNFELSPNGILTMTTSDGTQFTANIGSMIPVLTFNESDQIAVSVSGSGVNKTYSFTVKDGSITENKLQPNYLANVKTEVAKAKSSESNAQTYSKLAQSYAVGSGGAREDEATDNARYYYEQAKQTDIGQISSKVDEINSKLSEQLGSHTVKSDVPENAVFTDTVYDDTEVQSKLNNKRDKVLSGSITANEYGFYKIATITDYSKYSYISFGIDISNGTYYGRISVVLRKSPDGFSVEGGIIGREANSIKVSIESTTTLGLYVVKNMPYTDTFYEIYNLRGEGNQVKIKGCSPTKASESIEYLALPYYYNLTNKNKNIISELSDKISDNGYGEVAGGKNLCPQINLHTTYNGVTLNTNKDGSLSLSGTVTARWTKIGLLDTTLSAGTYTFGIGTLIDNTYLELYCDNIQQGTSATQTYSFVLEKETKVRILYSWDLVTFNHKIYPQLEEGAVATSYEPYFPSNNMLAEEKADKSETTVNLLNPTLQTTTINGITCTNNGDDTYTLNGTANGTATFILKGGFNCSQFIGMKLVGCPSEAIVGGVRKFAIVMQAAASPWNTNADDIGNGSIIVGPSGNSNLFIVVYEGATLDNLVFKPMITTNLDATYDDFVSYTGDTGKLNSDVASLLKRIATLESLVNKTATTVTE